MAATSPGTSAASPIITLQSSMCLSAAAAPLRCCAVSCAAAVSATGALAPAPAPGPSAAAPDDVEAAAPDRGASASKASKKYENAVR